MMKQVVRVAVNNNFNCTVAEFEALDSFSKIYPESFFFVNSNIRTPNILKLKDYSYKAVITLNPDIYIEPKLLGRLYAIPSDKIAFVRIKYIPGEASIIDTIHEVSKIYPVVITVQRFNSKNTISKYISDYKEYYKFSCSRYRLIDTDEIDCILNKNVYICDRSGLGCQGCGLCSSLTVGKKLPILSLNLSASGICMYNCVDCYSKAMQSKLRLWGKPVCHFDWIHKNSKQSGRTKHIKQVKLKKG